MITRPHHFHIGGSENHHNLQDLRSVVLLFHGPIAHLVKNKYLTAISTSSPVPAMIKPRPIKFVNDIFVECF